jgi:hypothetical protein
LEGITVSSAVYPVHVDATLDTSHLSRWLWLVKWLLAIPHYIVLAFLWVAFFVLSVGAFFAILFTGRYPRAIFDFNVGVLRWSWRVAYYTYGALATDRYPPFTLSEVTDYPAHLTVDYPDHLSRGLVLVKWWLLAIPQYLVVAFLAGSGAYIAYDTSQTDAGEWTWGGGLIGLLVFFAGVILLFTGRYPQQMYDLVLGLNRWVLRVAAYAGLMTDEYPPFRLDMGGAEPGGAARVAVPAGGPTSTGAAPEAAAPAPAGAAPAAPEARAEAPGEPVTTAPGGGGLRWGPGRVLTVILASLIFLTGGGLVAGGATLGVAGLALRNDQGFLMSPTETVASGGYAIASEPLTIDSGASADWVPQSLLGDVTVEATSAGGEEIFIGVARSVDAAVYLAGVEHSTLVDFEGTPGEATPEYRQNDGGAPEVPPGDTQISDTWVAAASGTGEQTLTWEPEEGDWTVVLMNADGSADVAADISVGAEVPVLWGVVAGLLIVGGLLIVAAIVLLIIALTVGRRTPEEGAGGAGGTGPAAGAAT